MAVKKQRLVVPPETQGKKWFNFGHKWDYPIPQKLNTI
jgi:hypothetical protein